MALYGKLNSRNASVYPIEEVTFEGRRARDRLASTTEWRITAGDDVEAGSGAVYSLERRLDLPRQLFLLTLEFFIICRAEGALRAHQ